LFLVGATAIKFGSKNKIIQEVHKFGDSIKNQPSLGDKRMPQSNLNFENNNYCS
jgi:hypothetical protein